ncbi:hypothetical protein LCGC14_2915890 [marine sediment metagenome]|uniref:Uncharacterized protein n=1 Tax=marine sediment metagenome TaxID=412755 RepID=A0A0F8XQB7_9ZZZZ
MDKENKYFEEWLRRHGDRIKELEKKIIKLKKQVEENINTLNIKFIIKGKWNTTLI